MKRWAPRLALKKRLKVIRKLPIGRASPPVLSLFPLASASGFSSRSRLSSLHVFRDPASFVPGQLHNNLAQWEYISEQFPSQVEPISFIRNKVDVADFIVPFKGKFAGKSYDAPFPPGMEFLNNPICSQFEDFISPTIIDRFKNGSLIFWGKVGEVQPLHLVMLITVEPSKPRMCHDERFLNLWIKDCPFSLDYLSDLPRYVGPGHFQTVCDDKSGYDHICLSPSSRTLFGLSWKGCYFVFNTLPFGWKANAYVYHSAGLLATSYIRTLGVSCSQYVDDRHAAQLMVRGKPTSPIWSDFELAQTAAFILVSVLTSLGYTLALSKLIVSCPIPARPFLGLPLGFCFNGIRSPRG